MAQLESLGGFFTSAPDLVAWGDHDQYLTVLAVGADQALWYTTVQDLNDGEAPLDPVVWQSLGGGVTSAPSAVRAGPRSIEVFATGPNSDILHWQCLNGVWLTWVAPPLPPVPGSASMPAPASGPGDATGPGTATAVPAGPAAGPTGLRPPLPVAHHPFQSLGGRFIGTPHATAVSRGGGCAVFAVGTDRALWGRFRSADGGFDSWTSFGGQLSSDPVAIEYQQVVFMLGRGLDSAIWWTVDGGDGWRSLGGTFLSGPYAFTDGTDLYVLGTDSQSVLQVCRWVDGSWGPWVSLDFTLAARATACPTSSSAVRGYALAPDSSVWSSASVFNPYGGPWTRVAGPFLTAPAAVKRTGAGIACVEAVTLGTDHAIMRITDMDG